MQYTRNASKCGSKSKRAPQLHKTPATYKNVWKVHLTGDCNPIDVFFVFQSGYLSCDISAVFIRLPTSRWQHSCSHARVLSLICPPTNSLRLGGSSGGHHRCGRNSIARFMLSLILWIQMASFIPSVCQSYSLAMNIALSQCMIFCQRDGWFVFLHVRCFLAISGVRSICRYSLYLLCAALCKFPKHV